ncbi:histidine phosphatase family protein [Actimicrobium antarcticum]|uniref:Alpha-ribazole phosphatase n=1 Tax=Actimicrobium antarcticum TaxID=1051899 RepID=A0ABP7TQL5_9BURK
MRLYLVRHPQTLAAKTICYGSTDVAVAEDELARVAAALHARLPSSLPMVSSPLRRCRELAELLGDGRQYSIDARLAEMHFGDWEGRDWNSIARNEIDAWVADLAGYQPGGGESVLQMAQRVQSVRDDLLRQNQDCIVICHAGTIRLMLALQPGVTLAETALQAASTSHAIAYGELVVIDMDGELHRTSQQVQR